MDALTRRKITASRLEAFRDEGLIVVYCAGPHCNGASRAAAAIARLEHPVKLMVGGIEGWKDEGFTLSEGPV